MKFIKKGDMGVYGIAVLSIFSSGLISVILILMTLCGIEALRYAVFILLANGIPSKRRSFTVLRSVHLASPV